MLLLLEPLRIRASDVAEGTSEDVIADALSSLSALGPEPHERWSGTPTLWRNVIAYCDW